MRDCRLARGLVSKKTRNYGAGCAQTATEGAKLPAREKLKVTQAAWSDYQDYLIFARNDTIQVPHEIID